MMYFSLVSPSKNNELQERQSSLGTSLWAKVVHGYADLSVPETDLIAELNAGN